MLRKPLAIVVANIIGLFVANMFVSGMIMEGGYITFIIAGAVLGFINVFVKPLIKFVSLPFIFLSMGLFLVVINALMLYVAENVINLLITQPQFEEIMQGIVFSFAHWGDYVLAAVILSLVNLVTHWFFKVK